MFRCIINTWLMSFHATLITYVLFVITISRAHLRLEIIDNVLHFIGINQNGVEKQENYIILKEIFNIYKNKRYRRT